MDKLFVVVIIAICAGAPFIYGYLIGVINL
jgi:hypothetical protein